MNNRLIDPMVDTRTLVDLLHVRAVSYPDRRAYQFLADGETAEVDLTYGELDRKAKAIAALLQNSGVVGERALLIYPPGLEYIAAFFGCLYAGVVAVPAYPPRLNRSMQRIEAIVGDAHPMLALTTSQILSNMQRSTNAPTMQRMQWMATDNLAAGLEANWRAPALVRDSLAFLQYTSGSTATPKGVMLTHGNLLHNLALIYTSFEHTPDSRGVIWLPPYHDMGLIGGILQPLYGGFPVTLLSSVAFLQRPLRWLQAITRVAATTSGGPNFAYDLCVRKITAEQKEQLDLSSWQVAFCGAEPIRPATLERFTAAFASCGFRPEAFYPCYGLAEATLIVSGGSATALPTIQAFDSHALEQHCVVTAPIDHPGTRALVGCGQSQPDQQIVIVHPDSLAVCDPGQVGEIWVSGPSITHGYWNRPVETEQTLRGHLATTHEGPFLRTGDLGFLHHNELFVTGRLKDLLIIRGRNHYPQDIELTVELSHMALRPGCGAAFSVEVAGEEQLVIIQEVERGYQEQDCEAITMAIRHAVAQDHEVQAYAIALIKTGSIPKTSSGKIQRQACKVAYLAGTLPVVGQSVLNRECAPSGTPVLQGDALRAADPMKQPALIEEAVRDLVATILHQPAVGITHALPLISLGMDSLQSVELSQCLAAADVDIEPTDLLSGMTLSQLVRRVQVALGPVVPHEVRPCLQAISTSDRTQLSFAQQRLWFLERLAPGNAAYHIPAILHLTGALDIDALERCFTEIVRRHEVLRTTFAVVDGQPVQTIHLPSPLLIDRYDLTALHEDPQSNAICELTAAAAQQPFDLTRGPLLRVWLLQLAPNEHRLLVTLHHIVADGWSMGVLVSEVTALYAAYIKGRPSPLPELSIQYADFAHWQRRDLQGERLEHHVAYWRNTLAAAPHILALPTDRPRPPQQTFDGSHVALALSPQLTADLRALSRREQVTLFMTLLAAFQIVLYYHTRQARIVVGTDIANRTLAQTKALIGFFANQLVLCTDMSGDPTFEELLQRVREVTLGAYAHQDLPFNKVVEVVHPERDASRNPLFQVLFVLENSPLPPLVLPGLVAEMLEAESPGSPFDMSLLISESGTTLTGVWRYNSHLFDEAMVQQLIVHFQTMLEAVVRQPVSRLSALITELATLDRYTQQSHAQALRTAHAAKFPRIGQSAPTVSQN